MKGITLLHMTANCKATTTKTAGYWQSSINLTEYRAQNHSHNYMEIRYNDRGGLTNQERMDGLFKKVARGITSHVESA